MTPRQIQRLRQRLGESVATFAARWHRSARTIEDWEQGRRVPDALVQSLLRALERDTPRHPP